MIYKSIDKFLKSFINREVSDNVDKYNFEQSIPEVVTYFKLLYINSGQGAFYNILSSYISDEKGLYDLLKKCYDRHKEGKLIDEVGTNELIVKSIFGNNFLKKFDKEAKSALPPIIAIFFSGFYKDDTSDNWLKRSRDSIIDVDVSKYASILKISKEKDLEEVGIELCEDLIAIREQKTAGPTDELKMAYMLMASRHKLFNNTISECSNYEKVIRIDEKNDNIASIEMVEACNRVGEILQQDGKMIKSISYYEKALKSIVALKGFKAPEVGKQNQLIATTQLIVGDKLKARKTFGMVLVNYEMNYGLDDPQTISIYETVIDLDIELNDFEQAYKTCHKIIPVIVNKFGDNSERALQVKSKLSLVCKSLRKYDEMKDINKKCLSTISTYYNDLHEIKGFIITIQADYLFDTKQYSVALKLYEEALDVYTEVLGENNDKSMSMYGKMGMVHEKLMDYDLALSNYEKEYLLRQSQHIKDDINVVNLKEHMGNIFRLQGNFPNALSYFNEVLEYKEEKFSEKHEQRMTIYFNLGKLYRDTGNFVDSYAYLEKALVIAKKTRMNLDEELIDIYRNIAILKGQNDELDEAVSNYEEVISRLSELGEYIEIAKIYRDIGKLYLDKEIYDVAIEYAEKAKAVTEREVGKESILNLDCVNLLAHVYNESGNAEKAIAAYQDVCKIIIDKFGRNNHNLAIAYENMSGVFLKLEKLDEAIDFLNLALEINIKQFGENSLEVSNTYSNIAFIEYLQKKHSEALMHYEKVLQINEATDNLDASLTAEIFYALGKLYANLGDYKKALTYNMRSMKLQETVVNDLEVVIQENFLIEQCYKFEHERKFNECINTFDQYVTERIKKQGIKSVGKGVVYQRIAECYKNLPENDLDSQALYLNKSLIVKTRIYGDNNPQIASDYVEFAVVNKERGEKDVALEYFTRALKIYEDMEGDNDFMIAELKLNVGMLLREIDNFSEAIENITASLNYFENNSSVDIMLEWKAITELGNTFLEADETGAALEYYEKSDIICQKDNYSNKACAAITFYNLGDAYRKLNKKRDAAKYYEKALAFEEEINGPNTFVAGALETNIALIYKSVGDQEKALLHLEKAQSAYEKSVGTSHNNYKYVNVLIDEIKVKMRYDKEREVSGVAKVLNLVRGY